MGIAHNQRIENALYGHKGDLKKKLRENNVPRWLKPDSSGYSSNSKYLKQVKREIRKDYDVYASFYIRQHGDWVDPLAIPDDIKERIQEFLDEEDDFRVREGEYYDGVRLMVKLGDRGGIQDIWVENIYKN